ncbi:MAG: hypothetical protein ACHQ1D_01180 [Nitrososphaerales archaeon]
MNFCKECKNAFTIVNHIDYCDSCRIILDIKPGEYQDIETMPELVHEILKAYKNYEIEVGNAA